MTTSKVLLLVGLVLAGGMAQAQKTQTAGQTPAPADTPAPAATPDTGATVSASDPQSIIGAMQALGFTGTLGADSVGDPMISAAILGTSYNIFFYGCVENADCQSLLFQVGYDLPNGWTLEGANEWNAGKIITDAYLDAEMDPYLEFFVTTSGGLNQENFAAVLNWWQSTLTEFEAAIGF